MIKVTASALSQVTKSTAAGTHYTAAQKYPKGVGIDGVGVTQSGQRVFFVMPKAPFGGMAEKVLVPKEHCIPVPDGVDDVLAAAIGNPGLSSMAALKSRADFKAGDTVLVHGATGDAGKLAVQISKYLGAKKVIATGRDAATLQHLKTVGADVTVSLTLEPKELEQALGEQFSGEGVDIVLDYLYGERTEALLAILAKTSKRSKPIRYVVIGSRSGSDITLPSAYLRGLPIMFMGSGLGSVSMKDFLAATRDVFQAILPAKLEVETLIVPLADVEKTWNAESGRSRVVFVIK